MSLPAVLSRLDASHENTLARLKAWLAIPSISTDPGYRAEVRRAGGHLVADLTTMGFEASLRETPGHPVVVGHRRRPGKPHILFYGHYDVQPVDPLELWEQPPFEPVVKEVSPGGPAICARGASDDKGQIMTFLEACRAIIAETGDLPVSLSVMIEGEEENGSINLPDFLEKNTAEFKADPVDLGPGQGEGGLRFRQGRAGLVAPGDQRRAVETGEHIACPDGCAGLRHDVDELRLERGRQMRDLARGEHAFRHHAGEDRAAADALRTIGGRGLGTGPALPRGKRPAPEAKRADQHPSDKHSHAACSDASHRTSLAPPAAGRM